MLSGELGVFQAFLARWYIGSGCMDVPEVIVFYGKIYVCHCISCLSTSFCYRRALSNFVHKDANCLSKGYILWLVSYEFSACLITLEEFFLQVDRVFAT